MEKAKRGEEMRFAGRIGWNSWPVIPARRENQGDSQFIFLPGSGARAAGGTS
jgi:hypothetical protein